MTSKENGLHRQPARRCSKPSRRTSWNEVYRSCTFLRGTRDSSSNTSRNVISMLPMSSRPMWQIIFGALSSARNDITRIWFTSGAPGSEWAAVRFTRFCDSSKGNGPRDYAASASSPAGKLNHLRITRVVAKALQRAGVAVTEPATDRLLLQEVARKRIHPYIYSAAEVEKLLDTARSHDSPAAPLEQRQCTA
jgi:hypothetical protein